MTSQEARDFRMAYEMHEKLNCLGVTENAVSLNKVFNCVFIDRARGCLFRTLTRSVGTHDIRDGSFLCVPFRFFEIFRCIEELAVTFIHSFFF